jgi:hypothetical protein
MIKLNQYLNKNTILKKYFSNKTRYASRLYPTKGINLNSIKEESTSTDNKQSSTIKKQQQKEHTSKFNIDLNNIDDYYIIGAEIFKNAYKDALVKKKTDNPDKPLDEILFELQQRNDDVYRPKVDRWQEPELEKYNVNQTRRVYYNYADEKVRHKFVPSYRYKVEPFNSIPVFKFPLINKNRDEHNQIMFKRNEFVTGFQPPFNINHKDLENLLNQLSQFRKENNIDFNSKQFQETITNQYLKEQDKDKLTIQYEQIINSIVDLIPYTNHLVLPNLLMNMFYNLGLNDKRIWIAIEQEVLNNLHHYTIKDISKIHYISTISSPKYASLNFRQILYSTVLEQMNKLPLEDLFHVAMGFRMIKEKKLYDKLAHVFMSRRNEFLAENKPANLARIFYSWASHKPKQYTVDTFYPQQELIEKFVEIFEDVLNENILKMDQFDVARFTNSLYLLKYDYIDLFIK